MNFQRYLAAKKTIDDRSLNPTVWGAFTARLEKTQKSKCVQVLEIGGGTGTMFQRLFSGGFLTHAEYTLMDADRENLAAAIMLIPQWVEMLGCRCSVLGDQIKITGADRAVTVHLLGGDVLDQFGTIQSGSFDKIIAHAFMDLMPVDWLLPELQRSLRAGGGLYLSINFDGVTALEPQIDSGLDDRIMEAYHHSMDERLVRGKRTAGSRSGRKMYAALVRAGLEIVEAGSSDWVVFSNSGRYRADEAYFLYCIIEFIFEELRKDPAFTAEELLVWAEKRKQQIERGELFFIAHQLDFFACIPESSAA